MMGSPQNSGIMVAGHSGDSEALKHQGITSGCFLRLLSFGSVNASTTRIERTKLTVSRPEAFPSLYTVGLTASLTDTSVKAAVWTLRLDLTSWLNLTRASRPAVCQN